MEHLLYVTLAHDLKLPPRLPVVVFQLLLLQRKRKLAFTLLSSTNQFAVSCECHRVDGSGIVFNFSIPVSCAVVHFAGVELFEESYMQAFFLSVVTVTFYWQFALLSLLIWNKRRKVISNPNCKLPKVDLVKFYCVSSRSPCWRTNRQLQYIFQSRRYLPYM